MRLIFLLSLFAFIGSANANSNFFAPSPPLFAELHSGNFDSTAYLDCGTGFDVDNTTTGFWASGWFKAVAVDSGFQQVFTKRDIGGTAKGWEFGQDGSAHLVTEMVGGSGKIEKIWDSNLVPNRWYYFLWKSAAGCTSAGNTLTLCTAGICTDLSATTNSDTCNGSTSNSAPFRIGSRNTGSLKWNGLIDEVIVGTGTGPAASDIYNTNEPRGESALAGGISYYRFETGSVTPLDDSSNVYDRKGSNHCTNTNVTYSTDVPVITPLVSYFDGSSTSGDFGNAFDYEYSQPFTINVFVRPEFAAHPTTVDCERQQTLASNLDAQGQEGLPYDPLRGWRFALLDDPTCGTTNLAPYLQLWNAQDYGAQNYGTLSIPVDGAYSMVTVSSDGTGTKAGISLYVEGVLQSMDATFAPYFEALDTLGGRSIVSAKNTHLGNLEDFTNPDGSHPADNHYRFKGKLKNLTFWSIVLPLASITALHTAGWNGDPRANPSSANLVSAYPLNGRWDTPSTIRDIINGNDLGNTNITFISDN